MSVEEKILGLETRRRIHSYILKYPGLHFRELIRKLNIPNSTLRYHLKYLKKRGLIIAIPEEGYVRYYIINNIGNAQKNMLHLLRQEVPRNIILYLLMVFCASQIEISKSLEKHPKTIEYHLKKLYNKNVIEPAPVSNGEAHTKYKVYKIVERTPVGKEIIYRLKDPYSTYDSVILYKQRSLNDNFCGTISALFGFFASTKASNIKRKNLKDALDSMEEILFEILPHPYHV